MPSQGPVAGPAAAFEEKMIANFVLFGPDITASQNDDFPDGSIGAPAKAAMAYETMLTSLFTGAPMAAMPGPAPDTWPYQASNPYHLCCLSWRLICPGA